MPIGMLVVLDSILNRITQNRAKGKQTFMKNKIYIAIICAFSIVFAVSSGFLIKHYYDSARLPLQPNE